LHAHRYSGGSGDDLLDGGTGFDDPFGESGNDRLIIREFGGFFAGGASGYLAMTPSLEAMRHSACEAERR